MNLAITRVTIYFFIKGRFFLFLHEKKKQIFHNHEIIVFLQSKQNSVLIKCANIEINI